jgi:hypothetical protein
MESFLIGYEARINPLNHRRDETAAKNSKLNFSDL